MYNMSNVDPPRADQPPPPRPETRRPRPPSEKLYRTSSGRVLTDTDFEALADEAEQGYDIDRLRPYPCPNCGATNWTFRIGLGIPRQDGGPPINVCNICSPAKPRNDRYFSNYSYVTHSIAPGQIPPDFIPGDFILTHRNDVWAKLIRFGERLRLKKAARKYSYWNHAAMIVKADGTLIEALVKGVTVSYIEKYSNQEYTIVNLTNVSNEDRQHALRFAQWSVGEKYGLLTFLNVILWAIFGGKVTFGIDGQEICSGLVARCLERYGEIFQKDPRNMMPSDLAMFYKVPIPMKGKGK